MSVSPDIIRLGTEVIDGLGGSEGIFQWFCELPGVFQFVFIYSWAGALSYLAINSMSED